jgi:succinate dehydrogenase / fumarate reductase cytochrome b subunit
MASNSGILQTSLGRKYWMAASGLFLIIFLAQHFTINFLSVLSADAFNQASHFMGTNPLIQFIMQPILMIGVVFHLIMGFVLELKNREARPIKYMHENASTNSSWMSRNMIISGIMLLLFLALHLFDFWLPEINTKFIMGDTSGLGADGQYRYYEELTHKFANPIRVGVYVLAFVFLALHLLHGFQSAFQSLGARHPKYTPLVVKVGNLFAILIPFGFIVIALYHFLAH